MDEFLKRYLGIGLAVASSVAGLIVVYVIYRESQKTPEQRASERMQKDAEAKADAIEAQRDAVATSADAAYGRTPLNKFADYLKVIGTGGLYVPPRLSGGTPVSVRGSIRLEPSGRVILVNDITAQGGAIYSRSDGTFDFRYQNQTYTIRDGVDSQGLRVADLRPAGVTR